MGKKYDTGCKGGEDCYDERHLCKIAKRQDVELIRRLVKNARFFCVKCGRAAYDKATLCKPLDI